MLSEGNTFRLFLLRHRRSFTMSGHINVVRHRETWERRLELFCNMEVRLARGRVTAGDVRQI